MSFNELPEFTKEFIRLEKKYRSLSEDLNQFKCVIEVVPLGNSKHFNIITKNNQCVILKARLFCRYLKGSSIRIIYAYDEKHFAITFIEIYSKSDKVNEDFERIREYLKFLV